MEKMTELSLAEDGAADYARASQFDDKDVIASLRSLIVTVCVKLCYYVK
jgi:hypothetical protein